MSYLCDIEDFTTDQLRAEIRRREEAAREGRCWYCGRNVAAHTCRYATASPVPGWEFEPPHYIDSEDCMGNPEQYWRVWARNPVTGQCKCGTGATAAEATAACIANAAKASA